MLARTLSCGVVLASSALILAGLSASAGDKKDKATKDKAAPSGAWVLKGAELVIEFTDKNVVKISPHGDSRVIELICKYSVEKEGVVKAKITGLEGKAKDKAKDILPVGTEFRFTWKVTEDTAKLSDVKGDNAEHLKTHLEGEYGRKK